MALMESISTLSVTNINERFSPDMSVRDVIATIQEEASVFSNERFERYLKRSKIVTPHYIQDFKVLKERTVDFEYLQQLNTLSFVNEERNLIIYGPSGTGKTWIGKMIATTACSKALRVKWIEFPDLYEELSRLYSSLEKQTLSSRLAYYSRFDLLCIDEFPSVSNMNSMLVQQIFNVLYKSHCSLLICTQMNPDKIDCVFDNGLGESIRGRILERAKRLKVDGEDLRLHESLIH